MYLKCPACDSELNKVSVGNILLDVCQGGCAGVWLDKNELKKINNSDCKEGCILFKLKKNPNIVVDFDKQRYCPKCSNQKLTENCWKLKEDIIVDICDSCNGLWLDNGELALILGVEIKGHQESRANKLNTLRKQINTSTQEANSSLVDHFRALISF